MKQRDWTRRWGRGSEGSDYLSLGAPVGLILAMLGAICPDPCIVPNSLTLPSDETAPPRGSRAQTLVSSTDSA